MANPATEQALQRLSTRADDHLEDLKRLIRVAGCAFPGFDPGEVRRSAQEVAALLTRRGLENVQLLEVEGAPPYVYADWLGAPGKPTLLLYAHHDVQPAGDPARWASPPFEPTERDGRLYGRGAADDKAGVVVHAAAVDAWLAGAGALPLNVRVLIEGEEEPGSAHLAAFLARFAPLLKADAIVLTDTANLDTGLPSLTTSLRGLLTADVEVRALEREAHSGLWGGPLPDAALALAKMLAALAGPDGEIALPGFYDRVRAPSAAERGAFARLPVSTAELRRQAGVLDGVELLGGGRPPWELLWRRPSLALNAVQASSREQARHVLCDRAWARIGLRLVPDLDPAEVAATLDRFLRAQAPWGVQVDVQIEDHGEWWLADSSGPVYQAALRALGAGYGREAVTIGSGGAIALVGPLTRALGGVPALLLGVEDPYSHAHAEDESVHLGDFQKACRSAVHLFAELAQVL